MRTIVKEQARDLEEFKEGRGRDRVSNFNHPSVGYKSEMRVYTLALSQPHHQNHTGIFLKGKPTVVPFLSKFVKAQCCRKGLSSSQTGTSGVQCMSPCRKKWLPVVFSHQSPDLAAIKEKFRLFVDFEFLPEICSFGTD